MKREYDADGFRRVPFGLERRLPNGRHVQARGEEEAIRALLRKLEGVQ